MLKPYDQLAEIISAQHAEEIEYKINNLGANSREFRARNWLKREYIFSLLFGLIVVLIAMFFIFKSGSISRYSSGVSFNSKEPYDFLIFQALTILAVPTIAYVIRAVLVSNHNSCIDLLNRFVAEQKKQG